MPRQRPELDLRESVQNGRRELTLVGELDLATAPRLYEEVARICAEGAQELLLDLRALSFIDSTGLCAMLVAREICETRDCNLMLTHGRPQVEAVLRLTGTAQSFQFVPLRGVAARDK